MKIITKVEELHQLVRAIQANKKKIALVPTMGYLHEGHASLIKRAGDYGDVTITTLFVNPTQFGPNEDFNRYPRDLNRDTQLAESNGCNFLFVPDVNEMYPEDYNTEIKIAGVTEKFEGVKRPGHFDGVATIVAKLFNASSPDYALFGQKDYQQTLVIKHLAKDMLYSTNIIVCPTVRESDGLAMSSRNVYLSSEERKQATVLYQTLEMACDAITNGERKRKVINAIMHQNLRTVSSIKIDYAASADAYSLDEPEEFTNGQKIVLLLALFLGKTRLIDNALITIPG